MLFGMGWLRISGGWIHQGRACCRHWRRCGARGSAGSRGCQAFNGAHEPALSNIRISCSRAIHPLLVSQAYLGDPGDQLLNVSKLRRHFPDEGRCGVPETTSRVREDTSGTVAADRLERDLECAVVLVLMNLGASLRCLPIRTAERLTGSWEAPIAADTELGFSQDAWLGPNVRARRAV